MSNPVDLTNLRTITDGDQDMEKALFEEFFSSFEAGMEKLSASREISATDAWKKAAHTLKGMSLNLGAKLLGELCKKAEADGLVPAEAKDELLQAIRAEYGCVRQFLVKLMT